MKNGVEIVIYEPTIKNTIWNGMKIIGNLGEFKQCSDIIITNRYSKELRDVKDKVYTRDIYGRD